MSISAPGGTHRSHPRHAGADRQRSTTWPDVASSSHVAPTPSRFIPDGRRRAAQSELVAVGVDHTTAGIEFRGRRAFSDVAIRRALEIELEVLNQRKEPSLMTARLSVNVFTVPEKAMVGERPRPFGPPMAWDPMTSTLIFGEDEAVLVDALTTVAEAEALASWVALHHRNLTTIYITHGHIDHFAGLSVLLQRFPDARAIATPKSVALMQKQITRLSSYRKLWPSELPATIALPEPFEHDALELEGHELRNLSDFGRLQESTSGDRELYDAMTDLYPDWVSHQAWLMFGLAPSR